MTDGEESRPDQIGPGAENRDAPPPAEPPLVEQPPAEPPPVAPPSAEPSAEPWPAEPPAGPAVDSSTTEAAFERRVPGAIEIVSRGLDLNVAGSADIRRTSIYIGLLILAAVGPLAAVFLAFAEHQGGFDWLNQLAQGLRPRFVPIHPALAWLFFGLFLTAFSCAAALSIDAQLLAVTLISSKATDRPFVLRRALRIARRRFWALLRASILIGLILLIPRFVLNQIVTSGRPFATESQSVILTLVGVILSVPFAYVAAEIVLAAVGARESVRRSWLLAQSRWRLALLIAIVNTAVSTLASFAVGAGLDILVRLATVFGLGGTSGPLQVAVLIAIVFVAILSIGSLTMTIAALTAAPQVVAFLGLTGVTGGLDAPGDPAGSTVAPPDEPLVTLAMQIALVVGAALGLVAVLLLL